MNNKYLKRSGFDMDLKNFIYEFNLASTMTVKDREEWTDVLNNNISMDVDYTDSVSLYHLVDSFNQLYLKFKKDQESLPGLGVVGDTRIVKYNYSENNDYERLVFFVDNYYSDKRFKYGEGILYIERIDDVYKSYLTNGLLSFEEGFVRKYLSLSEDNMKKYLDFGCKYDVLIDGFNYFKNKQVFGNGTTMIFTKINGKLLSGIDTFEVSLGNIYFNYEDYVNIVFRLGDKLEIDYEHSKVKLNNVLYEDERLVIDELVKKIYVNINNLSSMNDFDKKKVNANIRKLLPNG